MNRLLTDRINEHAPYDVEYDDELLVFTTEYGLTYAVDFDDDANPYFSAYLKLSTYGLSSKSIGIKNFTTQNLSLQKRF